MLRLAVALLNNCDLFLTNDRQLRKIKYITVDELQKSISPASSILKGAIKVPLNHRNIILDSSKNDRLVLSVIIPIL